MASWQMHLVALYLRATRKRRYATEAGGARILAQEKGSPAPPAAVERDVHISVERFRGFDVHTVRPRTFRGGEGSDVPNGAVMYLHGGAYVNEIVSQQWALVRELVVALDRPVLVPLYGLAPQHGPDEALELVLGLAERLGPRQRLHLVGDSAGGGLALAAAQRWSHATRAALVGLTLIAPWLDLSMSNPGIDEVEPHDPWLTRPGLRRIAAAWAGDLPLDDPRVSPLNGDLTGLPPIDVYVGTRDITLPDCRLLRDRLPADRLTYHEEPGAVHDYPLLPVPEGSRALASIIDHVRTTLR